MGLIKDVQVEGHDLKVSQKELGDYRYVVYNNIIYSWFSKSGIGKSFSLGLEKESTGERIFVKGDELKKVNYVLEPRGYLKI